MTSLPVFHLLPALPSSETRTGEPRQLWFPAVRQLALVVALPRPPRSRMRRIHWEPSHVQLTFMRRPRPLVRGDCAWLPRPCPFVGCSMNNYLDVVRHRARLNFPGIEPWEMSRSESCALDVADRGSHSKAEVARIVNVTKPRVHQIEAGIRRVVGLVVLE